jgi:hypothetical protein
MYVKVADAIQVSPPKIAGVFIRDMTSDPMGQA